MKPKYPLAWISFFFATSLTGIFLMSCIIQPDRIPGLPIGTAAFVCFFPMCFYFVAAALTDSRSRIEALETRIKELEAGKIA